jgi:hypothetical protein
MSTLQELSVRTATDEDATVEDVVVVDNIAPINIVISDEIRNGPWTDITIDVVPNNTQTDATQPNTESCCVYYQWPVRTTGWCGLPVEDRPDFSTVWNKAEAYSAAIPIFFLCLVLIFTTVYYVIDEETQLTLSWMRPPDTDTLTTLITTLCVSTLIVVFCTYPLGLLTWYGGVSVAITRKVTHVVFISFLPAIAVYTNKQNEGLARDMFIAMVWQSLSSTLMSAIIFSKVARKYVPFLRVAFSSIDRSDDRPFSLTWLNLQMVGMTMVQIPMVQWMLSNNKGLLIWIPFLSVALGDGLAEPVGKIWGKHKYTVRALFTSKKYTRSFEGSACVFFWTTVAVAIGTPEMNAIQAFLCFLTIPIANTVMEAVSPHSFDNHFMWGSTWLLMWIIFDVIPYDIV